MVEYFDAIWVGTVTIIIIIVNQRRDIRHMPRRSCCALRRGESLGRRPTKRDVSRVARGEIQTDTVGAQPIHPQYDIYFVGEAEQVKWNGDRVGLPRETDGWAGQT